MARDNNTKIAAGVTIGGAVGGAVVLFSKSDGWKVDCGICFESVRKRDVATCGCDHSFCKVCWKSYVGTAINDGAGCLTLRCPEPGCAAAVGPDMVKLLVGEKEVKRYDLFMLRTYVETNKKIKWCPGAGCEYAVEFDDVPEAEKQRELAKKAIERYTHYYERWAANEKSRKQARLDLHKNETVDIKTLSLNFCQPETQLQFIIDAWLQIVECRRVLKWTYAYGFYIPNQEEAKKRFFEYVQGEAETGLERLHLCAEKELQTYIINEDENATEEQFNTFRVKLSDLTTVTRSYFENLVRALENGLSDVDSNQTQAMDGSDQGGSSSKVRGRATGESSRRELIYIIQNLCIFLYVFFIF